MASTEHDEENWFDPDIAAMESGYGEKAGLQIFRNYTRAFETHAIKKFVEALDLEPLDLTDFRRLLNLSLRKRSVFFQSLCARMPTNY